MVKKYIVSLTAEERQSLEEIIYTGKRAAATMNHARILLKADTQQPQGSWRDQDIKAALDISIRTIERVRNGLSKKV
jgi:acid phosphatase class B